MSNIKKSFKRNEYTYEKIKDLVKIVGLKKTGIGGNLKEPKSNDDFEKLKILYKTKYNTSPSFIPIRVSCGFPYHNDWVTKAVYLQSGKWCRQCYIDSRRLTFESIKKLVEQIGLEKSGKEGILITTLEEFQKLSKKKISK